MTECPLRDETKGHVSISTKTGVVCCHFACLSVCVCSLSFCLSLFPFCLPASALLSFIQSTLIHYYLKRTKLINCRRCCCPFSFAFVYLDNPFSVGLGKEEKNDEKREIEIGHC